VDAVSGSATRRAPPTDINPRTSIRGRGWAALDAPRHRRLRNDRDDGAAKPARIGGKRCGDLRVNRQTIQDGKKDRWPPFSSRSSDNGMREAAHLVDKLHMGGWSLSRGRGVRSGRHLHAPARSSFR
jgi:hypothetical protein